VFHTPENSQRVPSSVHPTLSSPRAATARHWIFLSSPEPPPNSQPLTAPLCSRSLYCWPSWDQLCLVLRSRLL
jgi:hypothetical protein